MPFFDKKMRQNECFFMCKNLLVARGYAPIPTQSAATGDFALRPPVVSPPLPNPGCATACVLFRQKNCAKMSVFLAINPKIRGAWGLCLQTPLAPGGPPVVLPHFAKSWMRHWTHLRSFAPPPDILGWLRYCSRCFRSRSPFKF